jgi:hypothetical protein
MLQLAHFFCTLHPTLLGLYAYITALEIDEDKIEMSQSEIFLGRISDRTVNIGIPG